MQSDQQDPGSPRNLLKNYTKLVAGRRGPVPAVKIVAPGGSTSAKIPASTESSAILSAGPTPNTEVFLDLQVMLRIAANCTEDATVLATGELIGLEVSPAKLEISNWFPIPLRKENWNPREKIDAKTIEDKYQRELEKYRLKVRELLHYVDADCQSVGWFQTLEHTAFNDPSLVDQLYQRMVEVDRSSVMLGFDLERRAAGRFPFRAFQLSDSYINLRRREDLGEISAGVLLRGLSNCDLLKELPVHAKSTVAVDALLLKVPSSIEKRARAEERAHSHIANQLESGMNYLAASLAAFNNETETLARYQKESMRSFQTVRRGMDRKRLGHDDDQMDDDTMGGNDKKSGMPNQLRTLMMMKQMNEIAGHLEQLTRQNVAASALAYHN